jgi:uncharacterized phage protein gp47/JayE
MPFLPKSASDILRQLTMAVQGRSKLSDISPGSGIMILLQAFAEELASTERRMFTVRESFFMNGATGLDLDRRVAELPPVGIARIAQTNASGTVLTMRRDPADTAEALLIPAGSVVQSEEGTRYRTTVDVVMVQGDSEVESVHIIAESGGSGGNAAIASINRVTSAPDQIIACTNTQPISNGLDRETDVDLRDRAMNYLKSLSRCQSAAIEFMARSFVSTEGERYPYARLYEDPEVRGFCELVIDDGSGITQESLSRPGQTIVTTISDGGSRVAYHEAPAVSPMTPDNIIIHVGGDPNTQIRVTDINYTSLHERGVIYFKPGVVNPGDRVIIQNYRVYRGYVQELQREIEGDPSSLDRITGFRAAGTRVVVTTVTPQYVTLDIALTANPTADYNAVEFIVTQSIEEYISRLAPGETLFISQLIDVTVNLEGVADVQFYKRNSSDRADNIDTSSARHALRVRAGSLQITTSSRG